MTLAAGANRERLVDELELVAGPERVAQVALDGAAALQRLVHVLGEEPTVGRGRRLGVVERDVGLAGQLVGVGPSSGKMATPMLTPTTGLRCRRARTAGRTAVDAARRGLAASALDATSDLDDGELVAAEPRDGVASRTPPASRCGDLADQLVAGRVAQRVVDLLEAVEVEIEESEPPAVAAAHRRARGRAGR